MKLSLSFVKLLNELANGKEIMKGAFHGNSQKKLLEQFLSDGILDYQPIGTQQKKIYCNSKESLVNYLHHKFEIPSLELYIEFLEKEETQRNEAVKAASNSKIRSVKVFEGFLVNTYEEITGILKSEEVLLKPVQGSFVFINDYKEFCIPADVTVVVVEGHENFRYIQRQWHLFKEIKPLFIWRYQNSNSIANWLNLIPNNYLHFGDFDPKGIHIYISEFRNKIDPTRCNFYIPANIEELVFKYGEKKLYEGQMEYLKKFDFALYPEVVLLMNIISKLKKGLAQEILLSDIV